jgi:hypothetical protein
VFLELYSKRLKNPTIEEQKKINQLRIAIGQLPDSDEGVVSDAERTWNKLLNKFKKMVLLKDPREFIKWGANLFLA